jgi:hypothetical protein
MSDEDHLEPVFLPSLAAILAQAEQVKGGPLTETEVVRIRDKAICIMMAVEDAEKIAESRGYRDVNPENCWSDWHRLRVQLTGNEYLPKIILCLLCDSDFAERCRPILKEDGIEHEFSGHDDRMVAAFQAWAAPLEPSLKKEDFARIQEHKTVLYVLSKNFSSQEAAGVSVAFLQLGRRLLESGAIAMKCESSGIAHGRSRWIELAEQAESYRSLPHGSPDEKDHCQHFWSALFIAYVQLLIQSRDDFYTCGMHLLGKPDLIISDAVLQESIVAKTSPVSEAIDLFQGFAMYLLAECPEGKFGSGHTFQLDATRPRFRVIWEKCTGYEEDDYFFNPFGRWRFVGSG